MYLDISSAKICSQFPRKQLRIRSSEIYIYIEIDKKRIYEFFPSVEFLNFIKQQIKPFPRNPGCAGLDVSECDIHIRDESHLLRLKVGFDNLILINPSRNKHIPHHAHNARFSASANAGKDFHNAFVDERRYFVDIKLTNHLLLLESLSSIPQTIPKSNGHCPVLFRHIERFKALLRWRRSCVRRGSLSARRSCAGC